MHAWCASSQAAERRVGADVLGRLGCGERRYPYRGATISVLERLLSDENADVVQAALIAFGHLRAHESVPDVAALWQHPDPAVRHGVAFALLGHESDIAFRALIRLSRDDDAHVRDWSTFGLGSQIDIDTPESREAVLARAEDADPDTRAEALAGLVKRGGRRVLVPLRRALESEIVGSMEVEAARALGSSELLASLEKLRSWCYCCVGSLQQAEWCRLSSDAPRHSARREGLAPRRITAEMLAIVAAIPSSS